MIKLLRANMARLFKSKVFKVAEFFAVGWSIFGVIINYLDYKKVFGDKYEEMLQSNRIMDNAPFILCSYLPIILAVVVGLYIGTEYRDGTVRNKIIAGHGRFRIYFANLITVFAAQIIIFLTSVASVLASGIPVFKMTPGLSIGYYLKVSSMILLAGFACCAVFIAVSMCVQSKSTGVVIVMIISMMFLMSSVQIREMLNAPEYYEAYSYVDDEGKTVKEPRRKNSNYLRGTKRKVYETIYKADPYTPMIELSNESELPEKSYEFPLYSCGLIIVSSAVGSAIFKKRNLK